MKSEVEKLDEMARWEAVGKLSRAMTDTLGSFGTPKNLMRVAFNWFGMQQGMSIPEEKVTEVLEWTGPPLLTDGTTDTKSS
jgi:hypothetical protein